MHQDLKAIGLVLLASFLSALVGLEREKEEKPAGFRTHMIIGGAATLLILLGESVVAGFSKGAGATLQTDPLRLIEAIIVGVSFIGAGTILKRSGEPEVRNLTTAATLLFSAGIGICVAVERILLAVGVVISALIINVVMKRLERRWFD